MDPLVPDDLASFWRLAPAEVLQRLELASDQGLSTEAARQRRRRYGPNAEAPARGSAAGLLLAQFRSPIMLILILAAALSYFLANPTDATIILLIVLISGLLGFIQEKGASDTVGRLLRLMKVTAQVLRDGQLQEIAAEDVVPGDRVLLAPGRQIPGDALLLESLDLFVDESTLTGETFPVAKLSGSAAELADPGADHSADPGSASRSNAVFAGTHVYSGSGQALIVRTGAATEFGQLSRHLRLKPPETEFERGVREFGNLLMQVTFGLVALIFCIHLVLRHPLLDALLFAVALAVGLTPQLLPAIISINLAHGARSMSRRQVIVRRLEAIENFGSMDILCSDKTGTLTEGVVKLYSARDALGRDSETALRYAYLNAFYQKGFANPMDQAIRAHRAFDLTATTRLDEIPYDFSRKRLSILVAEQGQSLMVTKGAFAEVLGLCREVELDGRIEPLAGHTDQIQARFEEFSRQGLRVLGLACRRLGSQTRLQHSDEAGMRFIGFLLFFDPPKPGIAAAIAELKRLGMSLKIITGDNHLVARSLGEQIGLRGLRILRGAELRQLSDGALLHQVGGIDLFAEIEPNQKERIVLALKKRGHIVGYMGDGINDVTALHTADVSISVDSAVDAAKELADIVLMEKDLAVLIEGVKQGRITFANTLKYVFMATSANFGNMFSMAGASLLVSFLPLLPKQILLINLLTDVPELLIATDHVDAELVARPRRWNIAFIRRFMVVFGLLSSFFDFSTFLVLLYLLHASVALFRTAWFVESVLSASLIVLVIRSEKPFLRSRPGRYLSLATAAIALLALSLPYTPLAPLLGFVPLPPVFPAILALILIAYALAAEGAKRLFYRHAP